MFRKILSIVLNCLVDSEIIFNCQPKRNNRTDKNIFSLRNKRRTYRKDPINGKQYLKRKWIEIHKEREID